MHLIQNLFNKLKIVKKYLMNMINRLIIILKQTISTVKTYPIIAKQKLEVIKNYLITIKDRTIVYIRKTIAYFWNILYMIKHRVFRLNKDYGKPILLMIFICIMGASTYFFNIYFQETLSSFLQTSEAISNVKSLFLTLGGALISASVIVFTLVIFVMQANIERMPYGLFRKLSEDKQILISFITTIILAALIASISLIQKSDYIAFAMSFSFWMMVVILFLFVYAFKRALILVNPVAQLNILVKDVDQEMMTLIKRFTRLSPLLNNQLSSSTTPDTENNHDIPRIAFFKMNPTWAWKAEQGIKYSMSFAIRYAERGDHEVSKVALQVIINMNRIYIRSKGKTFFNHNALIDNPFSTDSFINNTLEHLRQAVKIAVYQGDEQFIEQLLNTMQELCSLYLYIDYSSSKTPKSHALLAYRYLSDAVKSVIPHHMTDVLMEGTRLISKSAKLILVFDEPQHAKSSIDDIGLLASLGAIKSLHRPVTSIAMEELASLDLQLISVPIYDIKYTVEDIRSSVSSAVKLFLNVEEAPLDPVHSNYLGPYYSAKSPSSLVNQLKNIANIVIERDGEDSEAITVINNIEKWADGRYSNDKELLLLTIEKRSSLIFDIFHWISSISEILLTLSNADACDARTQIKLRKHALWIVSVFDWIPTDEETTKFVEGYNLNDILFEIAMNSESRGCNEITETIQRILLKRGFIVGKYESGRFLFENTIYALATLALRTSSLNTTELITQITNILDQEDSLSPELKKKVAKNINKTIDNFHYNNYPYSSQIQYDMHQTNAEEMKQLLHKLANLLDPELDNA